MRAACFAAFLFSGSGLALAQTAPALATQAAPANDAGQPSCNPIADSNIPLNTTIQAKVNGTIDAAHLKPGKKFWVNTKYGMEYPGCRLENDAAIYGTVTSASASKNPAASELSLEFDSADCSGRGKQSMKLFLIGVIAGSDDSPSSHDAAPSEVRGGSRQISDTAADTTGFDAKLNPGGPPHTVHPGAVVGFKNLKLEPQGGPACSAKMSSTNRNIELGPGTVLVLAVRSSQ